MRKLVVFAAVCVLVLGVVGQAGAYNYVQNGDFETTDSREGKIHGNALNNLGGSSPTWDVYDALPGGWYTDDEDAGIEVQYDGTVVDGHSPSHYIELDSHGQDLTNSSLLQNIFLSAGDYILSFWYRPRTAEEDDNRINVSFGGNLLGYADGEAEANTDWELYSFNVSVGAEDTYTLRFDAVEADTSLGGFLDDVSLTIVPEPGTILLLGSGLLGLVAIRRKLKK